MAFICWHFLTDQLQGPQEHTHSKQRYSEKYLVNATWMIFDCELLEVTTGRGFSGRGVKTEHEHYEHFKYSK